MALKRSVVALTVIVAISFGQRYGAVRAAVPFTPAGDGHDTVPAFVNGKGPFAFVLDTGADEKARCTGGSQKSSTCQKEKVVTWADRQELCLLRHTR